jgi:hypothetical protein
MKNLTQVLPDILREFLKTSNSSSPKMERISGGSPFEIL